MSIFEAIVNHFNEHIDATSCSIEPVTPHIAEAAHLLAQTLIDDKKILCASSISCAAASHQFCQNLLGHIKFERPSLPAINLGNTISLTDNSNINDAYTKQINALGQQGDLLIVFSSNGDEEQLLNAIESAHSRHMKIITLTAGSSQKVANATPKDQVIIPLVSPTPYQAINLHFILAQMLSELVEQQIFGAFHS